MISVAGRRLLALAVSMSLMGSWHAAAGVGDPEALPDTGIGGVYEVMVGVEDAESAIVYFQQFGFRVQGRGQLSPERAEALYGVDSALRSVRMQNGDVDSHGLLRIMAWEEPLGPGVGYAPPLTVGQRLAVMRTQDIFRIADVFGAMRAAGAAWLATAPVYDDIYDLTEGEPSIAHRPVGVREMGVYGEWFNHVFFQRYGYVIPGYGSIGAHAPLKTSEFTHHDFVVSGDLSETSAYYSSVLGLRPEGPASLNGDWQPPPNAVFMLEPGVSYQYRGFVSPNNICGKIKLLSMPDDGAARDRSARQRVGALGITLHSYTTPKLGFVRGLAVEAGLQPTQVASNEFGERSFRLTGPDGVSWQLLARADDSFRRPPTTTFQTRPTDD